MSQSTPILILTLTASGAVMQKRLITYAGAQATVAGEKTVGVNSFNAANGEQIAVTSMGTAVVTVGAAVAVGEALTTDTEGRAVPVTDPDTQHIVADALQAGTTNKNIEVRLR